MQDTIFTDNRLFNLSPASRNEGPDSHKDNSRRMGIPYSAAANDRTMSIDDKSMVTGNDNSHLVN